MRVVITGASSGIGEALARHYAARGATLGLISRRHGVDVTDEAAVAAAAQDFMRRHGTPDLVIANAGIGTGTDGAWRWIDAHAPAGARVLTFFGGDHLYSHRQRLWSESVAARAATWGATGGNGRRVTEELMRLRIEFVLAPTDQWRIDEHRRLDLLRPEIMGPVLERRYADRFVVVYAVRAGAEEAPEGSRTTDHS